MRVLRLVCFSFSSSLIVVLLCFLLYVPLLIVLVRLQAAAAQCNRVLAERAVNVPSSEGDKNAPPNPYAAHAVTLRLRMLQSVSYGDAMQFRQTFDRLEDSDTREHEWRVRTMCMHYLATQYAQAADMEHALPMWRSLRDKLQRREDRKGNCTRVPVCSGLFFVV